MLSVSNVSFGYGGAAPVLDGFSMKLARNEVVSLLGPSGCGKSTVLRLIAGLIHPDQGEINWQADPDLAFVFQDHSLMPWATVQKNVELPGSLKGHVDKVSVARAIASVGLQGMEKRYPAELSGGQRMRASVARALVGGPSTLLMDEPFAALDEILRFQMNELLLSLAAARGFNVIFVTHSLYEAAYLSDRVLIMNEGRVSGEVSPHLNRSISAEQQRASAEFVEAVQQISHQMTGEGS